ncbi:GntR family transcriptional regulator [Devosia geojensis]|uniref:GntR family transcriptional regulator n=1 Tax=Devosia geojensis TaxID=443610 RepID=UPI000A00810E|nr:GntR family transcriptional regulator [Devosia geojensis]
MGELLDATPDGEDLDLIGGEGGQRPNLTEQVYEQLIELLISGELKPGDVITERRMAERLNASRTPIREALGRLEAEGLVYKQPNRGVTVSPFSTEAFVDILNVRQLLEAEAAYLASGKIAEETAARIRDALETLAKKPRPTLSEIWQVDDMLHGEIADAAGNPLMAAMIRDLRRRTHVFNAYRNPITPRFSVEENRRLLDAVASGDRDRARKAMSEHIETVKVAIIERLSGVLR